MLALLTFVITCSVASADFTAVPQTLTIGDVDGTPLIAPLTPPRVDSFGSTQVDLFTAPVLPSWPDDTPLPVQIDGGWMLPEKTANLLIRDALLYPVACQGAMDAEREYLVKVNQIDLDHRLAVEHSRQATELTKAQRSGWRWTHVVAIVGVTAAASFAAGYFYAR